MADNPAITSRQPRRGGVVALASSLMPGWGHLLVGRRRVGIYLLAIDAVLVLGALAAWVWLETEVVKAWVSPTALIGVVAINLAVLVYREAALLDSFFSSGSRGAVDLIVGLAAVALVAAPHLLITSLALTQRDLIEEVFPSSEPVAAPATTTSTLTEEATPSTDMASTTSEPEPSTTTTTAPPRIWDGHERLNVMLLGSDAGVGRIGTRTDTIIVLSIEPTSGNVAMFSVPRNLTEAPLPEGMGRWSCDCFPDIITHLWANAEWYPEAFPGPQEPPINALKSALGLIFDIDIHYYAKVDLKGFVEVIDAVGGVTIDVPKRIVDETYPHEDGGTEYVVIDEGEQYLDGHLALAYARIRRHSGDFARMHRQRCLLGALEDQIGILDIVAGFGDLAEAVKAHVETDIPAERLGDFIELLPLIDADRVASLRITRYNYALSGHAGYQLYDLGQIREDAHILMADPTAELEALDGFGLDATCEESFD